MPAVQFNDEEQAALMGLPWLVRCLYFELRRRMDFSTGWVGARKGAGINWQGVREWLYVEPHPGLQDTGTPSEPKVRRAAKWLAREDVGLAEIRSRGKKLLFFLPKATWGDSAQKQPDRNPTGETRQKPDRSEPSIHNESATKEASIPTGVFGGKNTQPDTPLVSGKEPLSTRACARDRFHMKPEWQPAPQFLKTHIAMQGMKPVEQEELQAVLGEFRSYWYEQEAEFTDGQWTQKLVQSIKRHRFNQTGTQPSGGGHGTGRRLSALERVKAANERARRERGEGETFDGVAERLD